MHNGQLLWSWPFVELSATHNDNLIIWGETAMPAKWVYAFLPPLPTGYRIARKR